MAPHPATRGFLLAFVFCIFGAAVAAPALPQRFTFEAFRLHVAKGGVVASFTIAPVSVQDQFLLRRGVLSFQGRLFGPPPLAAAQFFPTKLRVIMTHRAVTGTVIWTEAFDLAIQSDGRILHQEFTIPNEQVIHQNEKLTCSLIPVDEALPACIVQFTVGLRPGTDAGSESPDPPPFPRPGLLESIYASSGFIGPQLKGKETFHFRLKAPGGSGFAWPVGSISVSGSLVPVTALAPLPNRVDMIIRHRDPSGRLISVDHNVVQILFSGKIPLQRFVLVVGPNHTREELEISFVPLDRGVPPGQLQIRFAWSRG